jgi:hypothetical protein
VLLAIDNTGTPGLTWIVNTCIETHPTEFVPEAIYVVVTAGETEILGEFEPVLHVYETIPVAPNVVVFPLQSKLGVAAALTLLPIK